MIEEKQHYYAVRPDDVIFRQDVLDQMPVGTVIFHEHYQWTKGENGGWSSPGLGAAQSITPNREGYTALKSYPEGFDYIPETLSQWQWKLRDVTMAAARRHSVSGVPETLQRLHVTLDKFPVGAGMRIMFREVRDDLSILPIGSVVSCNSITDPDYSLFKRTRDGWTLLLGPRPGQMGVVCTVVEVGGIEFHRDWIDEPGSASSEAEIRRFKGKVWDEGRRGQAQYGWCGVFNQVLDMLGVNEESARASQAEATATHQPGELLDADAAGYLPNGTLFYHHQPATDTMFWYQVTSEGRNRARTRRVAAFNRQTWATVPEASGHFANRMTLLAHVGTWLTLPDAGEHKVAQYLTLPDRTRFQCADMPNSTFMKISNRAIVGSGGSGRWAVADFFTAHTISRVQVDQWASQ